MKSATKKNKSSKDEGGKSTSFSNSNGFAAGSTFIVPIGKTFDPTIKGFKYISDPKRIILVYSKESTNIKNKVYNKIKSMYDKETITTLKIDPKNVYDIAKKVIDCLNKEDKIVINISGGTKIMSIALYIVASLFNGRLFYLFLNEDKKMEFVEVPVLRIKIPDIVKVGNTRYKILNLLLEKDEIRLTELANKVGIRTPPLLFHLRKLSSHRLVKVKKTTNVMISITELGKIILHIMSEGLWGVK